MTTIRDQAIGIPNNEDNCSLDLRLPCNKGDDLLIPFGVVETQTANAPKSAQEKTATIAISPRIFNDAGLDKTKATAPNFIENIAGLPTNVACGYIYIFVDGFLWREVACVNDGLFSDVDLMLQHSQDIRAHSAESASKIILPVRTKGLYNGDTLAPVVVEMAFSRVQWSWQYINDLGGMFESDKRFTLNPLKSKCVDTGRGLKLREARCQKLDFTENDNPKQCEFIETQGSNYLVYLHDMLGIAQRYYVLLDEIAFRMESIYQKNKKQPYYDSALLACQVFLNDKLQKTRIVATNYWQRKEFIDKSSEASNLRKVASKLSREEIEKRLISPEEIVLLEQYLDFRETLINFLMHDYKQSTLTEICDTTKVHIATDWHIAMRDLSTLSTSNYHLGQTAAYTILNSVTKPLHHLPIFIQGMVTKKSKEKRQQLTERMAELDTKAKELKNSLSFNEKSWLRKQFCADINAFGSNIENSTAELVDPTEEPGIFDPIKFEQAVAKIEENSIDLNFWYVLALKATKTSGAVVDGMLNYWKKTIDLTNSPNIQKVTFQVVGTTLKSTGIDTFKNLAFAKFGDIADTHVILGGSVKTHSLFNHLSGSAKRRAEYALKHVTEALTQGKQPKAKYIKELEKHVSKGTHTSSSPQRNIIITDRKTGATVATASNAGVAALVQKHLDNLGSLDALKRLEIDVLMVPRSDLPKGIAHLFDDDDPLRGSQGLKLDKMSQYAKKFQHSLPGAIFLLDGMLAAYVYYNYETEFKSQGKNEGYRLAKHTSFIAELTVSAATVFEAYISDQTKMSQALLVKRVAKANIHLAQFNMKMKITRLTIATGVAGVIGAVVVAWDAYLLLQKNDKDAAIYGFLSAGTSGAASAMAAFSLGGPLFWGLIIASLVFGVISSLLINSNMDDWAEFGPFGKDESNRLKGFSAFANDRAYHNFICALLFSPSVSIKRLGGSTSASNFIIAINIPLYGDFDTDAYLDVVVVEQQLRVGNRIDRRAYGVPINHVFSDQKITHRVADPVEIRNEHNIIERFEYQASFDLTHVTAIRVKAAIMKNNIYYPQDIQSYRDEDPDDLGSMSYDLETVDETLNQSPGKELWAKSVYRNSPADRLIEYVGDKATELLN